YYLIFPDRKAKCSPRLVPRRRRIRESVQSNGCKLQHHFSRQNAPEDKRSDPTTLAYRKSLHLNSESAHKGKPDISAPIPYNHSASRTGATGFDRGRNVRRDACRAFSLW